jgi:hypothetical protein
MPRLTHQAAAEHEQVEAIISSIHLTNSPDERHCPLLMDCVTKRLRSGKLYKAIKASGETSDAGKFVWHNRTLPKVQFFCWLLIQERIKCRYNLKQKHVLDEDTCPICGAESETADHLILKCPFARTLWHQMGFVADGTQVASLWNIARPANLPATHSTTFIHLICWMLWKHRNDVVFNSMPPSHNRLSRACMDAVNLWKFRLPVGDRGVVTQWCNLVSL